MAALRAVPALRAVRHILQGIAVATDSIYGIPTVAFGEVGIGRRLSASRPLVASLLLQTNDTRQPAQGLYQWDFTIAIEMFYRVDQEAERSELVLADAFPAAMHEFYGNRRLVDPATGLSTVDNSTVSGPSSNPWYEGLAGPEYRMQVMFLNCWLRNTFDPTQSVP
jgi:hypothetical protein